MFDHQRAQAIEKRGHVVVTRRRVLTALAIGGGALLTAACGGAAISGAASTSGRRAAATVAASTAAPAATNSGAATAATRATTAAASTGSGATTATSAVSAPAAAPGTATYLLQVGSGLELDQYRELARRFAQQHAGEQVDIAFADSGDYLTKLQTMVAGGDPPETTFMASWIIPEYAEKGIAASLDSLVARDKLDIKSFYDSTVALCHWTVNGADHLYALPRHPSPLALYYNADLFKKQGVQPPDDTWTWDTLQEQAQKLATTDSWGTLAPYDIPYSLFVVVRSFGGDVLNKDWTQFILDESPAPEAVQWVADLSTKQRGAPPFKSLKSPSDATLFNQGKAAMILQIYPYIGTLQSAAKGTFAFDIARVPMGPKGRVNRNVAGTYTLITGAKRTDAGWDWLKFLITKESMLFLAGAGVIIPALRAAAQDSQFVNPPAPAPQVDRKVFLDALEQDNQIPEPTTPVYNQATDAIAKALVPVWDGTQDAKTALQTVAPAVNGLLATVKKSS